MSLKEVAVHLSHISKYTLKETSLNVQPFRTYLEPTPSKYQLNSNSGMSSFATYFPKLCFSQRQGTIHTSLHENGSLFSPGGQGRGQGRPPGSICRGSITHGTGGKLWAKMAAVGSRGVFGGAKKMGGDQKSISLQQNPFLNTQCGWCNFLKHLPPFYHPNIGI